MPRKAKRPRSKKFNGQPYQFEACAGPTMATHLQQKLRRAGFKSRVVNIPYCKPWNAKGLFSRKMKRK